MSKGITISQLPNLFYVIMLIGAFVGASYIMLESFSDVSREDTAVANESINFVANNTYYSITNTPVRSTPAGVLYDNETHLNIIPTSFWNYDYAREQIRVVANGTVGWPNITTGVHYFAYTYGASTGASTGLGYVVEFVDAIVENLPIVGVIIFIVLLVGAILMLRNRRSSGA